MYKRFKFKDERSCHFTVPVILHRVCYLVYFLGRLLKSFPRSGTEMRLQSSRFLSLKPPPERPESSSYLITVRGEFLMISFWVPLLPAEDSRGLDGWYLWLGDRGSGPLDNEMDREYPPEEESWSPRSLPLLPSLEIREILLLGGLSAVDSWSDSLRVE